MNEPDRNPNTGHAQGMGWEFDTPRCVSHGAAGMGNEAICESCDQIHSPDVTCPPHEVRVTGVACYQMQNEWLKQALAAKDQRLNTLESLCCEAANELTKTLPADHSLRVRLEAAGDGKEIESAKDKAIEAVLWSMELARRTDAPIQATPLVWDALEKLKAVAPPDLQAKVAKLKAPENRKGTA